MQYNKGGMQQPYNPSMQVQAMSNSYPNQVHQTIKPNIRGQTPQYPPHHNQYYGQGQMNNSSVGSSHGVHPSASQYEQNFVNSQYPHSNHANNFHRGMNNYQHSPIPGNPTPPLTPASNMPPYLSPNTDVKPSFADVKPRLPHQSMFFPLNFADFFN